MVRRATLAWALLLLLWAVLTPALAGPDEADHVAAYAFLPLPEGAAQLVGLRLVSVAFMAPLPLLTAATARTLNGRESLTDAAAVAPFLVPQLAHIGSVVTPEAPLIGLAALLTALLARVFKGDESKRTTTWVGVTLGAALLMKGWAHVLPIAVVAAYGTRWRLLGRVALVASPGMLWYLVDGLRGGAVEPSAPVAGDASLGGVLGQAIGVQVTTTWGRLAEGELLLPAAIAGTATVLAIAVAGFALWHRNLRVGPLLVGPGIAATVAAWIHAAGMQAGDGTVTGLAGRHAFVSAAGFAVLLAAGTQRALPVRAKSWAWAPLLGSGLVLQGIALTILLADSASPVVSGVGWVLGGVALAGVGVLVTTLVSFSRHTLVTEHPNEVQYPPNE